MASMSSPVGRASPIQTPAGLPPDGSVVNAASRSKVPPAAFVMGEVWRGDPDAPGTRDPVAPGIVSATGGDARRAPPPGRWWLGGGSQDDDLPDARARLRRLRVMGARRSKRMRIVVALRDHPLV